MKEVVIHLKPWKGRIRDVYFVVDNFESVDKQVHDFIAEYKKEGKLKRRTVTGYTVSMHATL